MDTVITEKEAANYLGLAVQTLRNWRHLKKGPPYLKLSRVVRYRTVDLQNYIKQNRINPGRSEK